ncbi:hypothetical protein KC19_7G040900 [Ceratodon purpureus]|uniref:Uncharacterized protein n=1 Tax=Ceratodon purpureus TaxID=3225 RepID=A0A8T0H772_CERPU|nr:hypothetical protein KC19_7G040900 [Ceratodon purpureus]
MARRKNGRSKGPATLYTCRICPHCPPFANNVEHIARHDNGEKHKRLQTLLLNRRVLEQYCVSYQEETCTYFCTICKENMELSFKKMKGHYKNQHQLPPTPPKQRVLEVTKVFQTKTYYDKVYDFEGDKDNFVTEVGLVILKECIGNCVGILRLDVIPNNDKRRLYAMASLLKQYGEAKPRGKKVGGTRMVMFSHLNPCLYHLPEVFVKEISDHLRNAFGPMMDRLDKILLNEGLVEDHGRFGNTPFTCFSITRNYECRPHDDPTDYGYGVLLWLFPDGDIKLSVRPMIWLPEYHVRFQPLHGSAFLVNCNSMVHCTTQKKKVRALGLAFVQKRNYIVALKKAMDNPTCALGGLYLRAKKRYESTRLHFTTKSTIWLQLKALVYYSW